MLKATSTNSIDTANKSDFVEKISYKKLNTLQEDETLDVEALKDHVNHRQNTNIEEYRTKSGKLVIKQAGHTDQWRSRIWVNIYVEMNELREVILMYLDNSCNVSAMIGFLRRSKELVGADKLFDENKIKVYKGDDDGKLSNDRFDFEGLLSGDDMIAQLGVMNLYIKSDTLLLNDKSNKATFTIATPSQSALQAKEETQEMMRSNASMVSEDVLDELTNNVTRSRICCNCVLL